jgi:hypothetical protein
MSLSSHMDYYFQKDSDVLFVNEDTQRVGILNSNPDYTLDIDGNVSASNILALNAIVPFIQNELLLGDVVNTQSNITDYIQATSGDIDHINCISLNALSNVVIGSNLAILNTYLNRECPIPQQGTLFGFSLGGGWIDPSWIKTDNDFSETLNALWDLGQTGWDIAQFVNSVFNPDKTIGNDLADALKEALSDGDSNSEGKIYVDWGNVKKKPIFANKTTHDVGVKGNLYLNEAQSLYGLNSAYFSLGNELSLQVTSTSNAEKILDIGTKEAYLNSLNIGSNVYMSINSNAVKLNNYTLSSNAITNSNASVTFLNDTVGIIKLSTSNVSASNVVCQTYTINNTGIWTNLGNPLLSQQLFDANGVFKGTVTKSQITDLEALDMGKLADGILSWNGYSSTSIPSLFDPFTTVSAPLYNII